MENNDLPILTVDGPVSSGKGTVSKLIASKVGWNLLDSGCLYRLVALSAMRKNIPLDHEELVSELAFNLDAKFIATSDSNDMNIYLEGDCVEQVIRDELVGLNASFIANMPQVRKNLLVTQRKFAKKPGLVADGRDMGTVVFPHADIKIYLTASLESRAERRFKQLQKLQEFDSSVTIDRILSDIQKRDERDKGRSVSPLQPAQDATIIDSSELSIDQVVKIILKIWASKFKIV